MELLGLLGCLGFIGGFLAGLVGLGGGIILAPLLLFVPPTLGLELLDMKVVARLTIIQSLCSTAAAGVVHRRARQVHVRLVRWMGPTIFAASLAGALSSEARVVSSEMLLGIFAGLALLAAILMCRCPDKGSGEEIVSADQPFSRPRVGNAPNCVAHWIRRTGADFTHMIEFGLVEEAFAQDPMFDSVGWLRGVNDAGDAFVAGQKVRYVI